MEIHADRRKTAVVQGAALSWSPSPQPNVDRRYLERIGEEVAVATSIVRYGPGARFDEHRHDLGEEILVLEGTFSDRDGDYRAGTYVRNPPGSAHAPFSVDGCVILVKLRQMVATDRATVRIFPQDRVWSGPRGSERALLHDADGVVVSLDRLAPGQALSPVPDGLELFVLSGALESPGPTWPALGGWGWLRSLDPLRAIASTDTLLWVKRGHLRRLSA